MYVIRTFRLYMGFEPMSLAPRQYVIRYTNTKNYIIYVCNCIINRKVLNQIMIAVNHIISPFLSPKSELNRRPHSYQECVLPTELNGLKLLQSILANDECHGLTTLLSSWCELSSVVIFKYCETVWILVSCITAKVPFRL